MIKAGDLVLCIDDDWTDPGRLESMVSRVHVKLAPKKGTVWLVTGVGHTASAPGVTYLRLEGKADDAWFNEEYFHPLTMREFFALRSAQRESAQ
jgi:hypothetical protein